MVSTLAASLLLQWITCPYLRSSTSARGPQLYCLFKDFACGFIPSLLHYLCLHLFDCSHQHLNVQIISRIQSHSLFPDLSYHHLTFGRHELLTGLFFFSFPPQQCVLAQQLGWVTRMESPWQGQGERVWWTPCLIHHCIPSVRKIPSTL